MPQKKNNLKSNHVAMNHCQKNVNLPMLPAMFLVCPSGTNTHVCGTTSTEKVKPGEKKSKIFRAILAIVYHKYQCMEHRYTTGETLTRRSGLYRPASGTQQSHAPRAIHPFLFADVGAVWRGLKRVHRSPEK